MKKMRVKHLTMSTWEGRLLIWLANCSLLRIIHRLTTKWCKFYIPIGYSNPNTSFAKVVEDFGLLTDRSYNIFFSNSPRIMIVSPSVGRGDHIERNFTLVSSSGSWKCFRICFQDYCYLRSFFFTPLFTKLSISVLDMLSDVDS